MAVETKPAKAKTTNTGKIVQIIGPVLDVRFEEGHLPEIYHAVTVKHPEGHQVIAEVQQHLGNNWVRAVAMSSTDGLRRGMDVVDTRAPITMPVGPGTLGRLRLTITSQAGSDWAWSASSWHGRARRNRSFPSARRPARKCCRGFPRYAWRERRRSPAARSGRA